MSPGPVERRRSEPSRPDRAEANRRGDYEPHQGGFQHPDHLRPRPRRPVPEPGASKARSFSAMVLPRTGLQTCCPCAACFNNPLYGLFTGVTATTGSEPTGVCDDPPTAGFPSCASTASSGRQSRQTRVFDIDRMGLLQDRGEHPTFSSPGQPVAERDGRECTDLPWPQGPLNNALNSEVAKAIFELGVAWSRLCQRAVHRQPDQQHVGWRAAIFLRARHADQHRLPRRDYRHRLPGRRQHRALVRQPRHRDQRRDVSAADPNIYRNLRYIASNAGLDPVQWAISMPWAMFYPGSAEVWPCAYLTYRCTNIATSNTAFVDSAEAIGCATDARERVRPHRPVPADRRRARAGRARRRHRRAGRGRRLISRGAVTSCR